MPRDQIDYHVSVSSKSIENYKEVSPGDFIISLRSFQGGIEHSSYHGICSPAYIVLRQKFNGEVDFFRHYFKSDRFIHQITQNIEGIRDGKMISYKQFAEQALLFPNFREQQKIADCLGSLDDLIAAEGRKLAALQNHKKGMLQQLFPREGETHPRLRFPKFRDLGEWEIKKLAELAEFSSGGTPSKNNPIYWNGNIPWISASSMHDMHVTSSELKVTAKAIGNGTRLAAKHSLLILVRGSILFKRVPICIAMTDMAFNQDVKALKIKENTKVHFILYQLIASSPYIPITETGIGAGKIETEVLENLAIGLPPLLEQQHIADFFSSLDDQIIAQSKRIDALKTHKKGLMQQLFPMLEGVGLS